MGDAITGDYNPPDVQDQVAMELEAFYNNIIPYTRTSLDMRNLASGNEAMNTLNMLNQYGSSYSGVAQNLLRNEATQNALTNAAIDELITGRTATNRVSTLSELDRLMNPDQYTSQNIGLTTKQQTADQYTRGIEELNRLFSGLDPNQLSGSEMAQIERGVNRLNANTQASPNVGSNTQTAANAMLFGDALQTKQGNFANMLSTFPSILSTGSQFNEEYRSPYDVSTYMNANRNPTTSASFGIEELFNSIGTGRNAANSLTGNLFGNTQNINLTNQDIRSQARNVQDFMNEGSQTFANIAGGATGMAGGGSSRR